MSIKSKLAFLWFCFHSLCGRSKNLHTFSTNHIEYYNQLEPGHLHFPMFYAVFLILLGFSHYFPSFWLALVIEWFEFFNCPSKFAPLLTNDHFIESQNTVTKTFKISGQVLQNFSLWTCDFQQTNKLTIILN